MAEREYVLYRGEKFFLQTTGRYYQSGRRDAPERLLHRRVWTDHHGAIPDGLVIHHIDGNWRNNDIANLVVIDHTEHMREHMRERFACPEYAARNAEYLNRAQRAAVDWHRSEEGLAWHREHGKRTWDGREPVDAVCTRCGAQFQTWFPSRARFCSHSCEQSAGYHKRFTLPRTCAWCGAEFMASRYKPAVCCSRTCNNRMRGAAVRRT